ncbi:MULTISPECIES: YceI family protein [Streptomyces]|uniref:YceI family protein n=1 Tax=Streptomyces koelreuteriae TaxID=2838015 RepID=A0ABX8FN22_9ACTN|nr:MULTISPECIES: YceI family protein [Streptomyces]QWB22522.1 YceI family protein [Streptomyces koelreuteriae]UUA05469.1 YceI family protein [Streptomyces koelreuteriae]UUA13095.1 YceI family protein [Streptomyces sp. CRCS-T-1]
MTVAVETGLWQLDATASIVGIRHRTMWGLVTVKGRFGALSGTGEVRPDGSAVGTLTFDVASLDTGNAKRDTHLRSADFFDADHHPEITFAARSAELRDGDQVHVVGQLTVRGISRPLSLTARLTDGGATGLTLDTEFSVDREQFGLGWNQLGMIRGLTTVTAALRFVRAAN